MQLLVEKYRPQSFEDPFLIKTPAVKRFEEVSFENLSHILLYGPPGTGKTTIATKLIPSRLYNSNKNDYVLELNASDERGIDVIRDKVKKFARASTLEGVKRIVVLDEADALTKDAQHSLRRIMELYSSNCVFILTCNYINKIIEPLKDTHGGRCRVIRTSLPSEEELKAYLDSILKSEGIKATKEVKDLIIRMSKGHVRYILDFLQENKDKKKLALENIELPYTKTDTIFDLLTKGQVRPAIDMALEEDDYIKLFEELSTIIYNIDSINGVPLGVAKADMQILLSEYTSRIAEGTGAYIHVRACLYELAKKIIEVVQGDTA
jgi:replication factor C small subunit